MEEILNYLKSLEINFDIEHHDAVYTIEEMENLNSEKLKNICICKNLFLRDQKGKKHFLYILSENKRANLSELSEKLESGKLSFASEERLKKYLNVEKGAVTPLAILFDKEDAVRVCIDKDLLDNPILGVHPGINTSTVLISKEDLIKYIESTGHNIMYI